MECRCTRRHIPSIAKKSKASHSIPFRTEQNLFCLRSTGVGVVLQFATFCFFAISASDLYLGDVSVGTADKTFIVLTAAN